MAFISNDIKCAVRSRSGGLSCALRSVNKSPHFLHSFDFDLVHTDEILTIFIHSLCLKKCQALRLLKNARSLTAPAGQRTMRPPQLLSNFSVYRHTGSVVR